jgi:ABC-type nitrate/sulfonate/bicarbonate transport system permease component
MAAASWLMSVLERLGMGQTCRFLHPVATVQSEIRFQTVPLPGLKPPFVRSAISNRRSLGAYLAGARGGTVVGLALARLRRLNRSLSVDKTSVDSFVRTFR